MAIFIHPTATGHVSTVCQFDTPLLSPSLDCGFEEPRQCTLKKLEEVTPIDFAKMTRASFFNPQKMEWERIDIAIVQKLAARGFTSEHIGQMLAKKIDLSKIPTLFPNLRGVELFEKILSKVDSDASLFKKTALKSTAPTFTNHLLEKASRCYEYCLKGYQQVRSQCKQFKNRLFSFFTPENAPSGANKCAKIGHSNLCWKDNPLAPGVTHYSYQGPVKGQDQRIQVLEADPDSVQLIVQDARSLIRKNEGPSKSKLTLQEMASRVPGVIGGINGGYFHYDAPQGQYYEWEGPPFSNGDPIGTVIVNERQISQNPTGSHWGVFQVKASGAISIDTMADPNAQHALGSAPLLIKNGEIIRDFPPQLPLKKAEKRVQIATPGVFQYHMNASHGRVAICETRNHRFLLVVAEGRMNKATGFKLPEFSDLLKSFGCENALNLDGGGSTDLVTVEPNGQVISTVQALDPKGKRPIASSILIRIPDSIRTEMRICQVGLRSQDLLNSIQAALLKGGNMIWQPSNSGTYKIKSADGHTMALFKPEDERAFGPANRNPEKRGISYTDEDSHFLRLSGFHQGKTNERQVLANLLDLGDPSVIPQATITELVSNQFFDLQEKDGQASMQQKKGLLAEWISHGEPLPHGHPIAKEFFTKILPKNPQALFPKEARDVRTNSLLNEIPLDEYQKIAILDVLLFNQDGHATNYLFKNDETGNPHLLSIDMDTILPFKLADFRGILAHPRSSKPFTPKSLRLITELSPDYVKALAERMGMPRQSCLNAKALSIVLQKFSQKSLSLAHIHPFILSETPDQPSKLGNLILDCQDKAEQQLDPNEKMKYRFGNTLRFRLWQQGGVNASPEDRVKYRDFIQNDRDRIDKQIDRLFWREFEQSLDQILQKIE